MRRLSVLYLNMEVPEAVAAMTPKAMSKGKSQKAITEIRASPRSLPSDDSRWCAGRFGSETRLFFSPSAISQHWPDAWSCQWETPSPLRYLELWFHTAARSLIAGEPKSAVQSCSSTDGVFSSPRHEEGQRQDGAGSYR